MDIILKALAGGILIGLVLWLSDSNKSVAAGLAIIFPIVTLIGFYFIGASEGDAELRPVVKVAAIGLPIWAAFIAVTYFTIPVVGFRLALLSATVVWILLALVLYWVFEPKV